MGNRGSVFDKYKAAVEKGCDIPEQITPYHHVFNNNQGSEDTGSNQLGRSSKGNTLHPFKLLYNKSNDLLPTSIHQKLDVLNQNNEQVCLYPPYVRKVTFGYADPEDTPDPQTSEYHSYKLDFGRNLKKKKALPKCEICTDESMYPQYARKVMFETTEDPCPRKNEFHPYRLDFGRVLKTKKTPEELRFTNPISIVPSHHRKVLFDDNPVPKKSEIHPYRFDFGCNVQKSMSYETEISVCSNITPTKSRMVGFDEDKYPSPKKKERHSFYIDFKEHILPCDILTLKIKHFNQLESNRLWSGWKHTIVSWKTELVEIEEGNQICMTWKPRKIHFTILRNKARQMKKLKRKRKIYKLTNPLQIVQIHEQNRNEVLHKSIVLASHIYWMLHELEFDGQKDLLNYTQNGHGDGTDAIIKAVDEVTLFRKNEVHPLLLARKSPNSAILKDGCPPVGRLNKMPHISFKERMVNEYHNTSTNTGDTGYNGRLEDVAEPEEPPHAEFLVVQSTKIPIFAYKRLKEIKTSKLAFLRSERRHTKKVLTVKMNALCEQDLIQDYLSTVLDNRFAFTISNVIHEMNQTECLVHLSSNGAAERFKKQLNRVSEETGFFARFDEAKIDTVKNETYLQNEWAALWKMAQTSLSNHQDKINKTVKTIREKRTHAFGVRNLESTLSEIDALEQKLAEYRNQMEEYQEFLGVLDTEFRMIDSSLNVENIVGNMKTLFLIEKERIDTCLPMYACKRRIVETIANNQVSILLGETGSGKSTQVAQYLYEAGVGNLGLLVCTQPRKVAAITLAKRVAQEMHSKVGQLVGFKVGMQRNITRDTKVLYMTDHMLLKECLDDPLLTKYSCIVIDEAHERSINTDLLLGMIKKCLPERADLRVIITSATIDPDVFINFFGDCPVLKVSGRAFPVEVVYSSSTLSTSGDFLTKAVEKAMDITENEEPGDILVFLTTPLETEKACDKFKRTFKGNKVIPLALHGKTQSNDLQKVFDPTPKGKRKIVFATNSAETSITIPGIKFVVDSGLVKEMQYDPSKSMSALRIAAVSRSSADQRKGRAGRTSVGKCYRLYSEKDYMQMKESTLPEILRVHLGMAILELMALQVNPFEFEFVQAPPRIALEKASEVLEFIGATRERHLTELGRKLSKLSLEPRLGKLVLRGFEDGIPYESVLVASFSSMGGNMFFRGGSDEAKDIADKLKLRFCQFTGDFHTMLNVFKEWDNVPEKDKSKWCFDNSINAKSMRMARDAAKEIMNTLTKDLGMPVKRKYNQDKHFVDIRLESLMLEIYTQNTCIFSGHEKLGYLVIHDQQILHIHPSSALKALAKLPNMLVFENTLSTTRDFMLNVTCISDENSLCLQHSNIQDSIAICKQNIVYPIEIENIGECTMKTLVGRKYAVLKSLETELQNALQTRLLILDANFECGAITIYSRKGNHIYANTLLSDVIEKERALMSMEEIEHPLIEASPIRAVIGNGGGIKHLLFPSEFRSIMIHDIPHPDTAESIMEIFREVGIVTDYQTNVRKEKKKPWVKVVFENQEAAKEALSALENGDLDIQLNAKPDLIGTSGIRSVRQPEIQLKVTWCRRPLRGIAFVKFAGSYGDTTNAEKVVQTLQRISIGGPLMPPSRVHLSKKNKAELFIPSVPKDSLHEMTVNKIKEEIENASGIRPIDVVLPRENVEQTSKSDVDQFKRVIETAVINEGIDTAELRIHMPMPKDKSFEYMAFIYATNNSRIGNIENALKNMTIMGRQVHVKLIMKSSIMVPNDIYPYVEDEINELIDKLEQEFCDSIDIKGKQLHNGLNVINLQCDSVQDMIFVRAQFSKVIEGKTINVEERKVLHYFNMNNGQQFLNRIMKKNGLYIQIDNFRHTLHLHGRKEDLRVSIRAIEKQISYLLQLTDKSFKLAEEYPPGMSKLLIVKYGIHLDKFYNDTLVEYVDLKLRTHTLYVHGDSKSIANTEKLLKILSNQLMEKGPVKKGTDMPDCAVCFCPIEIGDIYRLECCGHAYDKECVKNLFHHAIRDKDFPITCTTDGCGKNITVKDIHAIIGKSMPNLKPLLESAVDRYVSMHTDTLKYCITPNCPMVYKTTTEMNSEVCSMCCMKICTRCHCQFHEGLTCEMYQSNPNDEENLSEWLAADTENHALCPQCESRIFKDGGCMHMQCIVCKIHICWKCKDTFRTSRETYDHLAASCGGIFQ